MYFNSNYQPTTILLSWFLMFFIILNPSFSIYAQKTIGLGFAHAHNDYEKLFRKDFKSAIKAGCTSIEIDIFPYKGKLVVSHIPLFLGLKKDLESRYLKPLSELIATEGSIFKDKNQKLILMLDVKRDATKTYEILKVLCKKYEKILTVRYKNSEYVKNGEIQILLSGSKPYKELLKDSVRYVQLDGSLADIDNNDFDFTLIPRVSSSYRSHFKWRGIGKIREKEIKHLRKLVHSAHQHQRKIRFWAMPNNISVWELMLKEKVDWLNIDRLKKIKRLKLRNELEP